MIKTLYLHGLFFNACWFLCVIQQWALGALLVIFLWSLLLPFTIREALFIISVAIVGISVDSTLAANNWITFPSQPITLTGLPLWLLLLWLAFSRFCFHWFHAQYLSLISNGILFGLIGPINYLIGQNFNAAAIEWHNLLPSTLFILWWLLISPLCIFLVRKLQLYAVPHHATEK